MPAVGRPIVFSCSFSSPLFQRSDTRVGASPQVRDAYMSVFSAAHGREDDYPFSPTGPVMRSSVPQQLRVGYVVCVTAIPPPSNQVSLPPSFPSPSRVAACPRRGSRSCVLDAGPAA